MSEAERDINLIWTVITNNSKVVETGAEESKGFGKAHARVKSKSGNFSLAGAFVFAAARKLRARVLIVDADFKSVSDAILL